MNRKLIEMRNVTKVFQRGNLHDTLFDAFSHSVRSALRYGDKSRGRDLFTALDDVSFEVEQGESLAIVGSNGAGKSTILKLLCGILSPTEGSIITRGRVAALIEIGAGFHPEMTGRENIYLNGIIFGMSRPEITKRFESIVEFAGIGEFLDTPLKRYSSGMRARLGFAVAVHADAEVLLIDEVLSVGDFAFQRKCLDHMRSLLRSGVTVVFVSHNLKAVNNICDRALLLEKGKVIETGPTTTVVRHYLERGNAGAYTSGKPTVVAIENVIIHNTSTTGAAFVSGNSAEIEIHLRALADVERVSISLYLEDENFYNVFDTASQRLGYDTLTLKKGEERRCTFNVQLHLGGGTYHVGVLAHRYDIQQTLDAKFPATSIIIEDVQGLTGPVNVEPRFCLDRTDSSGT